MPRIVALVVAAGRGRRFGGDLPKQYQSLAGRPILRHSLATLAANPQIDGVRVVIHPDDAELYQAAAADLSLLDPVVGGETRQESVLRGLESLGALSPDMVLIHDGARPFVEAGLIHRVIEALSLSAGAIPALPVADTLKRAVDGTISATVDRADLWRAQTPQAFRYAPILDAHRRAAGQELTDDASVAEAAGLPVKIVLGSERNFKVTTAADLNRAQTFFTGSGDIRVGNGYDVHRFAPGTGVWLCGVEIPHDFRLEGHSDADVALHAATDAVLGAIAAADIGRHFPPSDPKWKGASSDRFLAHAANLVSALGGRLVHLDITIICEKPKIGIHRLAMQARIAEILGIEMGRISVKATTTEGLGFTGRAEGIAAQASATVWLPR